MLAVFQKYHWGAAVSWGSVAQYGGECLGEPSPHLRRHREVDVVARNQALAQLDAGQERLIYGLNTIIAMNLRWLAKWITTHICIYWAHCHVEDYINRRTSQKKQSS